MLGRSLRKPISALLMMVGALLVSGLVDMTPMIGSPQIDYPSFNLELPFWPQLALNWVAVGGGSILLVALGMLAFSDEPVPTLSLARTAVVALSWFSVISGLKLASFLAWGTMGPLNVQQPIFRFALTNGLVSAALVTLAWLAASRATSKCQRRRALASGRLDACRHKRDVLPCHSRVSTWDRTAVTAAGCLLVALYCDYRSSRWTARCIHVAQQNANALGTSATGPERSVAPTDEAIRSAVSPRLPRT